MRVVVRRMALIVVACLSVIGAGAQVQTGNISVKAVDDQGAVMPGATLTITSP